LLKVDAHEPSVRKRNSSQGAAAALGPRPLFLRPGLAVPREDAARHRAPAAMLIPRCDHEAERPTWDCRVCGQTWPCATAKVDLVEEFERGRTMLILFMGSCMVEAIDDLKSSNGPPTDLYDRFLGWARSVPIPDKSVQPQWRGADEREDTLPAS
jgi:hypothetical protein